MRLRVMAEKKFSTAFSQDAEVGVKWKTHLVISQPGDHLGMFVGSVVVQNGVNDFAGWNLALYRIEKLDELLVAMAFHAAADHCAV